MKDYKAITQKYEIDVYPRRDVVLVKGKGARVWDDQGSEYIDMAAGISVANVGHSNDNVVAAISKQAATLITCPNTFYNDTKAIFLEKLFSIAPKNLTKAFLTNSGAEAIEAAIKFARLNTKKTKFIAAMKGFHGRTMGSLQLTTTGVAARRHFKGMMQGVFHVPYAYCYRCPFKQKYPDCGLWCVGYIEEIMLKKVIPPDDLACLIVEPIQGAGGYIVPPDDYLPALAKLCKRNNIIMVIDEVQSGFCRTGKWWACEHFGVEPDIMTMSKAIAAGMPCGATVARAELMDWDPNAHENTLGGNPVVCAAALAVIDILKTERLAENAANVGAYLLKRFRELAETHELIGDVRGKGMMVGIEFVKDRMTKEPAKKERDAILDGAFKRGLVLLGAGPCSLRLAPPLILNREQADAGLEIFEQTLKEVEKSAR